jgi:hypothetical protein
MPILYSNQPSNNYLNETNNRIILEVVWIYSATKVNGIH